MSVVSGLGPYCVIWLPIFFQWALYKALLCYYSYVPERNDFRFGRTDLWFTTQDSWIFQQSSWKVKSFVPVFYCNLVLLPATWEPFGAVALLLYTCDNKKKVLLAVDNGHVIIAVYIFHWQICRIPAITYSFLLT